MARPGSDNHTYIPPQVERAMAQQLKQNVSPHLQQYVSGSGGYVPRSVEKALSQQIQKNLPAHLKQYGDAYIQQNVLNTRPVSAGPAAAPTHTFSNAVDPLRLGHSMPGVAQHTVDQANLGANLNNYQAPAPDTNPPAQPTAQAPYDFILNPTQPTRPGFSLRGGGRLMHIAAGGVALVVILFVIMLLRGGQSLDPSFTNIAQEQTEIARVAGLDYSSLSDLSVQNFALTTQLGMQSAQHNYLGYLSAHGDSISPKVLGAYQNSQTDSTLTAAQSNGTLDSTLKEVLQSKLDSYQRIIATAASKTTNPTTKQLLEQLYNQAGLLIEQSKQAES